MSKSKAVAQQIIDMALQLGWVVAVRGSVMVASKSFQAGDIDAFVTADSEYGCITGLLPQTRAGSVWGTDGSSVGAVQATKDGLFLIHKSGGDRRVISALRNLLDAPKKATSKRVAFNRVEGATAVTKAGTVVAHISKSVPGLPGHRSEEPWMLVHASGRIDRHASQADAKNDALKI